jgi:hypothetical protein
MELGVYQPETGHRLPLVGSDGADRGNSARLKVAVGVPDRAPETADLNIRHLLERPLFSHLTLEGYELEHEAILAGEVVGLRLVWRALSPMEETYRLQITVQGEDKAIYGQNDFDLVSTDYPTTRWQPGEVLSDWYYLDTKEDSATGEAVLKLDLVDETGHSALEDSVEVAEIWVQSTTPSFDIPTQIRQQRTVNLGDQITLLGHDVDRAVRPGETARVTLYWQAQRMVETSYKVFVHLYDGEGGILAQRDRLPGLGARPTTTWEEGEVVADRYYVQIPPDAPVGSYQLGVGLYDPQDGQRLVAFGPDEVPTDHNRIILGSVAIEP